MQSLVHDPNRPAFPFDLHWDARQLADAVPLRLYEAINFQALHYGQCDASVNDARLRSHAPARSYVPLAALSHFRIR